MGGGERVGGGGGYDEEGEAERQREERERRQRLTESRQVACPAARRYSAVSRMWTVLLPEDGKINNADRREKLCKKRGT